MVKDGSSGVLRASVLVVSATELVRVHTLEIERTKGDKGQSTAEC